MLAFITTECQTLVQELSIAEQKFLLCIHLTSAVPSDLHLCRTRSALASNALVARSPKDIRRGLHSIEYPLRRRTCGDIAFSACEPPSLIIPGFPKTSRPTKTSETSPWLRPLRHGLQPMKLIICRPSKMNQLSTLPRISQPR